MLQHNKQLWFDNHEVLQNNKQLWFTNKKKIENNSYRKGSLGVLPQHKFEKLKIIQFQFNTVKATSGQKGMVHEI